MNYKWMYLAILTLLPIIAVAAPATYNFTYYPQRIGGSNSAPPTQLEIAGSIKFGNGGETCNSTIAGALRWTGSAFEGCNGTSWTSLSGTPAFNNMQVFTSSGTFTPTPGVTKYFVECMGGGGGGAKGGGGSGGAAKGFITTSSAQTVTIGAGGAASTTYGQNGGSGGATTFGSFITANGGQGGGGSSTDYTIGGEGGTATMSGGLTATGEMGGSMDAAVNDDGGYSNLRAADGGAIWGAISGRGASTYTGNGPGYAGSMGGGGGGGNSSYGDDPGAGGDGYCIVMW